MVYVVIADMLHLADSSSPPQARKGSRAEWQHAIGWYSLAASVQPGHGNPFNQLAVMSYQVGL